MKILDIIEKKLYKESGSNKLGSHKSPDEKIRSRSVNRNHHHFQKHSHRISQSRSSPSPVKKHFENKYLTKRYYDKNMKDFFELKLGSMAIDEYEKIIL
jgi:hypothetical protein